MQALDALARMLTGTPRSTAKTAVTAIRELYRRTAERARQLARHAARTPHEAGRRELEALALAEREHADRMRRKVLALGGFPGDALDSEPRADAPSYWGRLVLDLEAHRDAVRDLLDAATAVTDSDLETALFLRQLAHEEDAHALRLRALIARSDPHALN